MKNKTYERVMFRLILMPCCGHMLCWVNPRRPNHCPECGEPFLTYTGNIQMIDPDAVLELHHD